MKHQAEPVGARRQAQNRLISQAGKPNLGGGDGLDHDHVGLDFVDVYALNRTFTKQVLLEHAAEVDAGFDLTVFAEMLDHLARYANADLELGDVDVAAVREFFRQWAAELRSERT